MISLVKFNNELNELITFLVESEWPFHAEVAVSEKDIRKAVLEKWYEDGRETFWVIRADQICGLLIIHDIEDTIPLFDLRLAESCRGHGIGSEVLEWLKTYLFDRPNPKVRIEAYTRVDNIGMRKAFTRSGFVKEGYLRNAWESDNGEVYDAFCYAATLEDWKNGTIRSIRIDEEPY
ncbi:GNAT family N-acetyltransferase [Jeotgalibacillus terrae]|uniref:GNAT family N-acetyltransferase n=1 Tax=Jeotgalibacillus terrae TaxID=587735 RepID=A0ABW5ZH40_9BACL|nr:GNAT family protein [Jeotgalibacillus terrae]MBM7578689.1 RimJ/RimL family protein N-acetyltransferase [Jeotgalibacillus terrae]